MKGSDLRSVTVRVLREDDWFWWSTLICLQTTTRRRDQFRQRVGSRREASTSSHAGRYPSFLGTCQLPAVPAHVTNKLRTALSFVAQVSRKQQLHPLCGDPGYSSSWSLRAPLSQRDLINQTPKTREQLQVALHVCYAAPFCYGYLRLV